MNAKCFFAVMCAIVLLLSPGGFLNPVSSGAAAREAIPQPAGTENLEDFRMGEVPPPKEEGHYPAHYIVFQEMQDGSIQPLTYRQVELSSAPNSMDNRELASFLGQPDRDAEHLAVALTTSDGQVLYRTAVEVPRWLRGEFQAADSEAPIEGYLFAVDQPTFVVRVPVIPDTQLTLSKPVPGGSAGDRQGVASGQDVSLQIVGQFDLAQLATTTPQISLPAAQGGSVEAQITGNPANRVDFLVMGDGYTASQQAQFNSDAATVTSTFFGISPYQEYRNYVNTYALFTASAQSGADHPPYQAGCRSSSCCADTAMQSDPLQGTFVNTAFDATYCSYYTIHRLLTVNTTKVLSAAAAVPDWDEILVIVNDTTYGGSGGSFAVASLHSKATQIAQHEYGHTFVGLADEYESAYAYPPCSDLGGGGANPCEPNVTNVTARSQIKWNPWINSSTPIPTSGTDAAYATAVGLFEGARYLSTGMYRSGQKCLMRALGAPYCQVPSQAYVLKLYNGGWGVPSSGIQVVEPGSASPAGAAVTVPPGDTGVFHADILQPVGGPPASIQWLVNGIADPLAHTDTFTYTTPSQAGSTVEIRLLVEDVIPLVNASMAGNALKSSHTWTVTVGQSKKLFLPLVSSGR